MEISFIASHDQKQKKEAVKKGNLQFDYLKVHAKNKNVPH